MTKLTPILAAVAALALVAPQAFADPTNTMAKVPAASLGAPAKTEPKTEAKTETKTVKTKGPAVTAAKTAEGKACSAEADAKGLHGKARQAFRAKCKKDAKPAAEAGAKAAVKADAPKTEAPKVGAAPAKPTGSVKESSNGGKKS